ncbi:MAG TPA: Rrf2 family transcriptional regulator [Longimicrobiales bacterium]|nr:Rrf2 family transcriptional regulator [Longimicrobiales bacterium]
MLNQSADHALRAVLFVARQAEDVPCSADLIASTLDVPRNYLGKLLNTLAQTGVLLSTRGPRGGFRLAMDPASLPLARIVEPFHRLPERRTCLLGNGACDPDNPCESHDRWQAMTDHLTQFFERTTVATMLSGHGDDDGTTVIMHRTRPARDVGATSPTSGQGSYRRTGT